MSEGTGPGGAHGETATGPQAAGHPGAPAGGWAVPGGAPPSPPVSSPGTAPGGPGHRAAGTAYPVAPQGHAGPAWQGGQPVWSAGLPTHKPGIVALRPLSLGDIIEGSFACLRRSPRTFLGLALLTSLAVLLAAGLLFGVGYLVSMSLESTDTVDLFLAFGLTSAVALVFFLSAATSIALSGILAYPVGEAVLGRAATMGETWRRTRRYLPRLMGLCLLLVVPASVVFGLVIALTVWGFADGLPALGAVGVLGTVALLLAALWLGVRLSLAPPALVLEDLGVVASLRRSWALTTGLFWRTLGILLASNLLIGVVQYVLATALQLAGMVLGLALASMFSGATSEVAAGVVMVVVSVVGSLISGIITQPFLAAVLALLYTDARIRKEGFDLALARAVADAGRGGGLR